MSDSKWSHGQRSGEFRPIADEVMADWISMLRRRPPWNAMLLDDMTGEFRPLLAELLHAQTADDVHARAERIRRLGRAHGAFRRRQRCPALVLREELFIADEAIGMALMRMGAESDLITTIQDSLAPLIRAVERAEYGGYVDVKD